ncbi:MAG TPA: PqiC family protein [Candidatus Binatia bacterium]|nr:PqiC family protein [Candidatus Binatia bacterium]
MRRSAVLLVYGLAVFLAGCGSSPATHYYTLGAAAEPVGRRSSVSVAVGPISIPAVVDRPQFVVSTAPNQIGLDEFNQWASPLQNNIARVVVENLVALLGTPRVILNGDAEYRASIEVQRFESAPGEAAVLDAVWSVRRLKDGKTETGRTTAREAVQGRSYDALAAAHSRALARLSRDIADAVLAFDRSAL